MPYYQTPEGLWTAEFESIAGRRGTGVIVFVSGNLMGGDNQYYYLGKYSVEDGDRLKAFIEAIAFAPGAVSVFGLPTRKLTIPLAGVLKSDEILCRSTEPNLPLAARLTRRLAL